MKKQKNHLGALIKEYRIKAGYTQSSLAAKLNYNIPQFISLMENGHSKIPVKILGQLIAILGIPEKKALDLLMQLYRTEAKAGISQGRKKSAV
jgi:transcriptional regulator with XRE-family HTH domain